MWPIEKNNIRTHKVSHVSLLKKEIKMGVMTQENGWGPFVSTSCGLTPQ